MKKIIRTVVACIVAAIITTLSCLTLAGCNQDKKTYFEADTTYTIDEFVLFEFNFAGLLDADLSYFQLNKDGTCKVRITPSENIMSVISPFLEGKNMQLDMEDFAEQYLYGLFPGFDLNDMDASIDLIDSYTGIRICGLDDGSAEAEALKQSLASGNLDLQLPKGLAIEINSVYNIEKLHSDFTGDYTALYIGNYDPEVSQEPFFIATLDKDDYGRDRIYYYFEHLKATIVAIKS